MVIAWPDKSRVRTDPDGSTRSRILTLMEGYCGISLVFPQKRRILMVGSAADETHIYTKETSQQCNGWIRPIAIRGTSGDTHALE